MTGTATPTAPGRIACTGHRDLDPTWKPLVSDIVLSILRAGRQIAVGDATGLDAYVREAAQQHAQVFRAASRAPADLAQRSATMVDAVAASGAGAGLVGLVSRPCPTTIVPSTDRHRCWNGSGEGTWSSLAYGAARGLTIIVFWCDQTEPHLPAWLGGNWRPARPEGLWARGHVLMPLVQTRLFDEAEVATVATNHVGQAGYIDAPPRARRTRRH